MLKLLKRLKSKLKNYWEVALKTKIELNHRIQTLSGQVENLEDIIRTSLEQRREEFNKLKGYFNDEIKQNEDQIRETMGVIVSNKNDEISKLKNALSDNASVVEGAREKAANMCMLEDETVYRTKLASELLQKGIQQLEIVFKEFGEFRRKFKVFDNKDVPKLKNGSSGEDNK